MGFLEKSSFGQFLFREMMKIEQVEDICFSQIVSKAVDRWRKMSKKKRSAYRWAAMDPEEKEKLASFKPISKIEKFEKELEGADEFSKMTTVTELAECAVCGV